MRPTEILSDCDRYLLGVADALYQLSTQYRVGSTDREFLQKHTEDLLKIQSGLKQMNKNWIANQTLRRKTLLEAQEQYNLTDDVQKKQRKEIQLKSLCKACGHYKWVHEKAHTNACGSKESTCTCTKYTAREDKKIKE